MKIFLDSANIEEIKKADEWGVIDGVTTNPTLLSKENKDFKEIIKEIVDIIKGPISIETLKVNSKEMVEDAKNLAKFSDNIVIKIPMSSEGLKAIKILKSDGIKTNATLIFSINQALLAAKAGVTYISIFVGRLDDISNDGMQTVKDIIDMSYKFDFFNTDIIAASIRHPLHIIECYKAGVDIVTVPFNILEKMVEHPLTDRGIERFLEDWKKYDI